MRRMASNDNDGGRFVRLQPVRSSAIRALGYDAARRVLDVIYPDGDRYRYFGVSPQRHRALMAAGSIGSYVNEHIKPHYRFEKLD